MAACDYYSCDLCGGKTFYDAYLEYDLPTEPPYEVRLPGVGAMKVICVACADTNAVTVHPSGTVEVAQRALETAKTGYAVLRAMLNKEHLTVGAVRAADHIKYIDEALAALSTSAKEPGQ